MTNKNNTALTENRIDSIKRSLPKLEVARPCDDFIESEDVQAYLDHYSINFSKELNGIQHQLGTFETHGFILACHIWRPEKSKGTVFFQHGYTDNVGLMQHIIRALLNDQWSVVAYDLPGHGLSSGKLGCIGSFDEYRWVLEACLTMCQSQLPKPWVGAGQSTGAAIWFNYLRHHQKDRAIDTAVMLAPLVRIYNWNTLRFAFPILKNFVRIKKRSFNQNSNDSQFLNFVQTKDFFQPPGTPMRWVNAMKKNIYEFVKQPTNEFPIKVITGDDDRTVDAIWNMEIIKKKFNNADITVFKDVRHQIVNESKEHRDKIFSSTLQWLNKFV